MNAKGHRPTYGTNENFVSDPDNGIVSSPATYSGMTMVTSLENTSLVVHSLFIR